MNLNADYFKDSPKWNIRDIRFDAEISIERYISTKKRQQIIDNPILTKYVIEYQKNYKFVRIYSKSTTQI